jgi:hypothetical protein
MLLLSFAIEEDCSESILLAKNEDCAACAASLPANRRPGHSPQFGILEDFAVKKARS